MRETVDGGESEAGDTYGFVELLRLTVANLQSTGLIVETVGARDELTEFARARKPSFEIEFLRRRVVQFTGDDVHHSVRDAQLLIEFFGITDHLLEHLPRFVVMG